MSEHDTGSHPNDTSESQPVTRAGARAGRREERRRRRRRQRLLSTLITAAVVIVLVGGAVWLFTQDFGGEEPIDTATTRNPSPGLDGVIAENMAPEDIEPGDCLTDFVDTDSPVTVVECDRAHDAQLIGRQIYTPEMNFPGSEQLRSEAEEFCASIQLSGQTDATVVTHMSHPSEGSWGEGDRRVDCVAVAQDDTLLSATLIDEPVVNDLTDQSEGADDADSEEPEAEESPAEE